MDIDVVRPCNEDWDAMAGSSKRRFCATCSQHVHDLSAMTEPEASALLAAEPPCVRFRRDASGRMIHRPSRSWPLLVGLLLAPAALASPQSDEAELWWWERAARAVYAWWYEVPAPLPPIDLDSPHTSADTGLDVTQGLFRPSPPPHMGKPMPRPPVVNNFRKGHIEVTGIGFTSVEVICSGIDYRERTPLDASHPVDVIVPYGEDCRLYAKGGPTTTIPVHPGDHLVCDARAKECVSERPK